LTYFSINEEEEAVSIEEKKESNCNFCVGGNPALEINNRSQDFRNENSAQLKSSESNFIKTTLVWICGIEKMNRHDNKKELPQTIDKSIDEDPKMKLICDMNAIVAIGLSCFCFGFFNKYI